jgi:hypothetical protein
MSRVRRHGLRRTTEYVISCIKNNDYPLYYAEKFIAYALKHKEFELAGNVIDAVDEIGKSHPLIDKLKGAHLWGLGRHQEAIALSIKSANRWLAPYIYFQVSEFLAMDGQQQKSDYYFDIANSLAQKEEKLCEPTS